MSPVLAQDHSEVRPQCVLKIKSNWAAEPRVGGRDLPHDLQVIRDKLKDVTENFRETLRSHLYITL